MTDREFFIQCYLNVIGSFAEKTSDERNCIERAKMLARGSLAEMQKMGLIEGGPTLTTQGEILGAVAGQQVLAPTGFTPNNGGMAGLQPITKAITVDPAR